jgi:methionyl-tRNA formyltransferase
LTPTPVHKTALEKNLEILQAEKLRENNDFFDKLKSLDLDFIIVVAYGKIIPNEILEIPSNFVVNIHGSILPLYR